MKSDKRAARMREIEAVAYALIAEQGFESTSMLAVAKAAKASNQTLYRWYGDKRGLFLSMVEANTIEVRAQLEHALSDGADPLAALREIAPVLLAMLLDDKAVMLNRAAASDVSGRLGQALAAGGREQVFPLIQKLLAAAVQQGYLAPPAVGEIGTLFMHLLVGDLQIRRVIGTMPAPSENTVRRQAACAMDQLVALCRPDGP